MNLRLLLLALTAALPLLSIAQVGNGVVFYSEANLAFTPTTVDSTTILTVELGNEVGVAQTVSLSGLDGPFSLLGLSEITIGSEASSTLNLAFAPTSLGDFTDTLHAQGAVFGEADIVLSGEGIQVLLEWSADTLYFDTTAIGATSYQDLIITNVGNGTAAITDVIIDNDAFSVEFLDPYVPPTPQAPCYTIPANDYGGDFDVPYREFYLTIEGGTFPDNLYWQFSDPWGAFYYDSYGPVTDHPICLPDNWQLPTNPSDFCCYNYFDFYAEHQLGNPVFTDGIVFTLKDQWDNAVWTFDLGQWPDYNYSNQGVVTTGAPPPGPSFTPGLIGEGLSTIARVSMTPPNSGSVEGSMTLANTSTNSENLNITLLGSGISEVSGELCDVTWTLEDSPFSFNGPVIIPEGCSLTIEAGVSVLQQGYPLDIQGQIYASGTSDNLIQLTGGNLRLAQGLDTTMISHLNRLSTDDIFNLSYTNDFNSSNEVYEFDCYDYLTGNFYTGNTTNANYGCDYFDFSSNRFRFYSNDGDGYVFPADTLIASSSGLYQIRTHINFSGYYPGQAVFLEILSGNDWVPKDSIVSEQSGNTKYFLKAEIARDEAQPILYRIRHRSQGQHLTTYIHDIEIGPVLNETLHTQWDIASQGDTLNSIASELNGQLSISNDTLTVEIDNYYGIDWNTEELPFTPVNVPASGQFYCSVDFTTSTADRGIDWNLYVRKNQEGNWYSVVNYTKDSNYEGAPHDWKSTICKLPFTLEQSDRLDFRLETDYYSSGSSYDDLSFSLTNIQFFRLESRDLIERPTRFSHATLPSLYSSSWIELTSVELPSIELGTGSLTASDCDLESIKATGGNTISLSECSILQSTSAGIEMSGDNASLILFGCRIAQSNGAGIKMLDSGATLDISHCFIHHNNSNGIYVYNQTDDATLRLSNSLVSHNHGSGIHIYGSAEIEYSTIVNNEGHGLSTYYEQFSTIENSIFWFNTSQPQINTSSTSAWNNNGVNAVSYSNIQGLNSLLTSTEFAWGDGCIGTDPVLADSLGHLDPFSPCVDGGMPWEQDAHIPYGLGSSRADMGMYGGPANAYWGGQAPPDGAVVITDIFDIPQDQGGKLGMHFTASPFDFGGLGFNVTHYSVWRDLSLGSDVPTIVGDGNWEQIGMVPAQGFSQYGYTAETLVDATPGDTTCLSSFIVIAHTTDDNIYWVSDVAAACSYDNLAPLAPELDGDVLLEEPDSPVVVVSWPAPEEDDYAYTVIERADGVSTNVVGDTLLLDADVEVGLTYDYMGYHLDLNGNPSDTAYVSVTVGAERDVIPLNAGWNLVSLDRSPEEAGVASVMSELMPGNLLYVTGFDAGATFYDPNGLSFLNTLSALADGYGYWIKVAADDTLRVEGSALPAGLMPTLDAGWNLIAYTAQGAATPETVFADLLADESLEYVTGFDGGVQFFDPAGLPFLNSLEFMKNGFGYWVKTDADYEGMAVDGATKATPNPNYIILNGTSNLDAHAGQTVAVVTAEGDVVAEMAILEGGHLMTTAVYGAGPSGLDGIAVGEPLYLEFAGERTEAVATWTGDMAHVKLDVQFDGPAFSVFPNPATDWIDVRFELTESGNAAVDVLDAAGRLVMSQPLGLLLDGEQQVGVSTTDLVPGTYQVRLVVDGRTAHTTALQRVR